MVRVCFVQAEGEAGRRRSGRGGRRVSSEVRPGGGGAVCLERLQRSSKPPPPRPKSDRQRVASGARPTHPATCQAPAHIILEHYISLNISAIGTHERLSQDN